MINTPQVSWNGNIVEIRRQSVGRNLRRHRLGGDKDDAEADYESGIFCRAKVRKKESYPCQDKRNYDMFRTMSDEPMKIGLSGAPPKCVVMCRETQESLKFLTATVRSATRLRWEADIGGNILQYPGWALMGEGGGFRIIHC